MPIFVPERTAIEMNELYSKKLHDISRTMARVIEDLDLMDNTPWCSIAREKGAESIQIIANVGPDVLKALRLLSLAFQQAAWELGDQEKNQS